MEVGNKPFLQEVGNKTFIVIWSKFSNSKRFLLLARVICNCRRANKNSCVEGEGRFAVDKHSKSCVLPWAGVVRTDGPFAPGAGEWIAGSLREGVHTALDVDSKRQR